jgi:hypothetical protein
LLAVMVTKYLNRSYSFISFVAILVVTIVVYYGVNNKSEFNLFRGMEREQNKIKIKSLDIL